MKVYKTCLLALALQVACSGSGDDDADAMHADTATAGTGDTPKDGDEDLPDAGHAAGAITVSGPVSGGLGTPFTKTAADLPGAGYSEEEFFFGGDASAYAVNGEMGMDGQWELMKTTTAPFKSRLLVRLPEKSKFNGTVVVEWLNVSGGADGDPGFMYNAEEILREGYAWVGVSAQAVGVEGGGFSLGGSGVPLKQSDPERYGSLSHPGDDYSFDIFRLAARAIRGGGDLDVLDGLKPEHLIAYGESQSAMRMVSYVNGVQPLDPQYDGFFIHSRGGSGIPFSGGAGGIPGFGGGTPTFIRDDLQAKVFQFQTETDVAGMGFVTARQPDSDMIRTWEVAGTAHANQHIVDFNKSLATEGAVMCDGANDGPQQFVIKAALHALYLWVRYGTEPARGELLTTNDSGALVKDEDGNALGGVRSPDVDVPIATLSGEAAGSGGDIWCFLFGSTVPFTPDKLIEMYPTHDDYVTKVKQSAAMVQEAGFLLEPEAQAMIAEAEAAGVPE